MPFSTIGIMSPGVMGSGVGRFLARNGYRVVTALDGRSDFTRRRAAENGFEDLGDLDSVVADSDLVLSILDPAKAVPLARDVAAAMTRTNRRPVFADCNATSPQTACEMQGIVEGAGGVFVDVGIIGARPTEKVFPVFATSGAEADLLAELDGKAVKIMKIGPEVGQGSAVKICNGAYNKGAFALYAVVMLAAEHYGCTEFLRERLPHSQAGTVPLLDQALNRLPALSGRYVGEMEQVAETFESIGLPGGFHDASATLFRMLNATSLGSERREQVDPNRSPVDVLRLLVAEIEAKG
jgi:3-hydroxyisobutyrate dehydrogenase-like beta-hydroxyacid dehydrogenase